MNENAIDRKLVCAFIDGLISDDGEREKGLEYIRNMPFVKQEQKADTWSIKEVVDTLEKHGLIREQEPCEDAISRQAVHDIVDSYSESQSNVEDVTQDIIADIVALPPVNPQEPKTGRWISHHHGCEYECSECHDKQRAKSNYCPNCGAKMVEPQERSDKE